MSKGTPSSIDQFSAADDIVAEAIEQEPETAARPVNRWRERLSQLLGSRDVAILGVAILLFIFFTAMNPRYGTPENLVSLARRLPLVGIIAVGMTFLFIAGELDLSVGANYGLCISLMSLYVGHQTHNPWLISLVVIGVGLIVGLINGLLVTRVGLPSFIATLGMLAALRGLANYLSGGVSSSASNLSDQFYQVMSGSLPGTRIPNLFVLMVIVMAIGAVVLAMTKFGSDVYSTGGNVDAARNNGINVRRVKMIAFMLTGALCGLGGAIMFGRLGEGPSNPGFGLELQVIAAIVVGGVGLFGGRGTIVGAFLGNLILAMLSSGLIFIGVKDFWDGVVTGVVILAAASLDLILRYSASRAVIRATA